MWKAPVPGCFLSDRHGIDSRHLDPDCHARLWAELESRGAVIGPHDLQIAATTSVLAYSLGTINTQEFQRISGLQVVDGNPFLKC
jgi:hypothetical protein